MNGLEEMFSSDCELEAVVDKVRELKEEIIAEQQAKAAKKRGKKKVIDEPVIVNSSIKKNNTFDDARNTLNYYAFAIAILGVRQVSTNNAAVYSVMDLNSKPIKTLKDGTTLTIEQHLGKWTKVEFLVKNESQYGYILTKNITTDDEISVDDSLHMIGYDRKNNIKSKEPDV